MSLGTSIDLATRREMYHCISSLVLNSPSFMCATVRFPDKRAVDYLRTCFHILDTVRLPALMGRGCRLGFGGYERFLWLYWLFSVAVDTTEHVEEEACDMLGAIAW
jgi:hypothetical protein